MEGNLRLGENVGAGPFGGQGHSKGDVGGGAARLGNGGILRGVYVFDTLTGLFNRGDHELFFQEGLVFVILRSCLF